MSKLSEEIKRKQEEIEELNNKAKNYIFEELKKAKYLEGVEKKGTCMIVKSSLLTKSWSPKYFDNELQISLIENKLIAKNDINIIIEFLEKCIKNCFIEDKNEKIYLNENIVSKLKEILSKI